ncbi:MAG: BrnA antitoxin family protein [Paracoccaceae bacterium]|nr:BrnA antitoxin family protein [Paracoccaceae bacterium]MDE2676070.1 BrnA antitoxin family protein [Paracoccaceae bacterium]MDE2737969.1 BrnA antitoxin family protein [Paracoccaceae bacterium]MYG09520.1 BrnA antitoxin family protein [Paracoccaceae bacterium]
MKKEDIRTTTLQEALRNKGEDLTDWEALAREEATGIEPESDPEEGIIDWSSVQVIMPRPKQSLSVRLDADVIDFFKAQGKGYQTRMNAVLRSYMLAHKEDSAHT